MDKYLCLCGMGFRKKQYADDHVESYTNIDSAWPHQVIKRKWKTRLLDLLINSMKYWKFIGVIIIYFVLIFHFDINFNFWESTAIGIGLGLAID